MSKTPAEPSTGEREALEVVIDSFIEDYEMIGEDEAGRDGYYAPTDFEQALIKDAIMGLMSEDDFIAAYRTALAVQAPSPVAPSEPVHQWRTLNCADWYDGHPDHADDWGPYETRTLYAAPIQPRQAEPMTPAQKLDALKAGVNIAETLLPICRAIGFGRVQRLVGDMWDTEHGCAPRGSMGVTVKDEPRQAPSDALTEYKRLCDLYARSQIPWSEFQPAVRAILSTQGGRNG